MNEQFYDLSFEQLPDGTVRIVQRDCGESYTIDAHPVQIIHLVSVLEVSKVSLEAKRIRALEHRLRGLHDRFVACYGRLPSDFMERCADAGEFYSWLDASIDVATEYCADLTLEIALAKEKAE